MAGDWIKVEKATPDKSEMRGAARLCGVSVAEVFLGWFRLWTHFDAETEDGFIAGFTQADADFFARMPGLGFAFEQAGWLVFDDQGCHIQNWERHNGKSSKKRAVNNYRLQAWRKPA